MQEHLTLENLQDFQKRFGTFHDGVIHDVKFDLFSKSEPINVQITVGTRDFKNDNNTQWINVTFVIKVTLHNTV